MPNFPRDPLYENPNPRYVSGVLKFGPRAGVQLRAANARNQLAKVVEGSFEHVLFQITQDMQNIITAACQNVTGEVGVLLDGFSESMRYKWSRTPGMLQAHETLGKGFQDAVVARYKTKRGKRPSYRQDDRYSGQKLLRALESPSFYAAQPDGLLLLNIALLDREAKQWYRLNFGAGPVVPEGGGSYPLLFPGQGGGSGLTLRQFGPSGDFFIPPGVFSGQGELGPNLLNTSDLLSSLGKAQSKKFATGSQSLSFSFLSKPGAGRLQPFFPLSKLPEGGPLKRLLAEQGYLIGPVLARGIRGEGFFDAGLQYLAAELPKTYLGLFDTWLQEAAADAPSGPAFKAGISSTEAAYMRATIQRIL